MVLIVALALIVAAVLLVVTGPVTIDDGGIAGGWYIVLAVACLLGGLYLLRGVRR